MIAELKGSSLLAGQRGQASRDVDALVHAVSAISHMAWTLRSQLIELDINPLFVRARSEGVVAGDALVVKGGA